jgi:hypothetical protein
MWLGDNHDMGHAAEAEDDGQRNEDACVPSARRNVRLLGLKGKHVGGHAEVF